jgi:hypothetical protein
MSNLLLHWRPCRDYVKKVAVYKDRVAVQLPSRVVLYKLDSSADDMDMQYRSAAKINQKMECNLLVVASNHILLCQVRCLGFWHHRNLEFVCCICYVMLMDCAGCRLSMFPVQLRLAGEAAAAVQL